MDDQIWGVLCSNGLATPVSTFAGRHIMVIAEEFQLQKELQHQSKFKKRIGRHVVVSLDLNISCQRHWCRSGPWPNRWRKISHVANKPRRSLNAAALCSSDCRLREESRADIVSIPVQLMAFWPTLVSLTRTPSPSRTSVNYWRARKRLNLSEAFVFRSHNFIPKSLDTAVVRRKMIKLLA